MHITRRLVLIATVSSLFARSATAQSGEDSYWPPLVAGDSVRMWTRPPQPFLGFPAVVARYTADSLALSSGLTLGVTSLTRLEVRRVVTGRSGGGAAGGAIGGLFLGALVGGAIGYYGSGGGDGVNKGDGDGMGMLIGVPVGAVIGAIAGGLVGGREQRLVRWIQIPLRSRQG